MSRYSKFIVALIPFVIAALKVLSDALGDAAVSNQEWAAVAITLLGAVAVRQIPNTPPAGRHARPDMSEQGN